MARRCYRHCYVRCSMAIHLTLSWTSGELPSSIIMPADPGSCHVLFGLPTGANPFHHQLLPTYPYRIGIVLAFHMSMSPHVTNCLHNILLHCNVKLLNYLNNTNSYNNHKLWLCTFFYTSVHSPPILCPTNFLSSPPTFELAHP